MDPERDPRRPPGLALVVIALLLLVGLGYLIYPRHGTGDAPAPASSDGPSPAAKPPAPAAK
jgi:hypothetical protein